MHAESLNAGGPREGTTKPRPDAKEDIASATHAGRVRRQCRARDPEAEPVPLPTGLRWASLADALSIEHTF
jgi:hypothetical protein